MIDFCIGNISRWWSIAIISCLLYKKAINQGRGRPKLSGEMFVTNVGCFSWLAMKLSSTPKFQGALIRLRLHGMLVCIYF